MAKDKIMLKGQVALITGSSSGIGKGIALAMAAAGAKVVVNYHSDQEEGEAVVKEIEEAGGKAIAVGADVSKEDEVKRILRKTTEHFGRLDILVNNAGIQEDKPLVEMSLEDWNKVIDLNLTGQFLCTREAAKIFLKQDHDEQISKARGKIIFITSVHQRIPWAGRANYAAAKAGLKGLMETVAQELAPEKIRVNSIAPGAIKTSINEHEWSEKEGREAMLEKIPYGRIGETEDIGRVAAWLASDEADYIAGTTIFVDGAMTNYPLFLERP
jgi:glucose 1-dehydrogenase